MSLTALFWPIYFADQFFLALWPSLLWAVAIGIASAFRDWRGRLLTLLLSLLPITAGALYFGVSHASDESFLLAGVIPWSDAAMHFRQAAQMAIYGITQTGMNGRFLYPAYFSSLLTMSTNNLLVAEALSGLLFAGSLVVTLRVTARIIGASGACIVALVCWLFFRERCAGLIMTENLGIMCGLLALAAFLRGLHGKHFYLVILGIFMLSLGLCARPGALVVLPLLIAFSGWLGWQGGISKKWGRLIQSLLAMVLALLVVLLAFNCNRILADSLYEGKVISNQNFSFTLNGLLTGGKWSDCLGWSHWDSKLVMRENLRLIQEQPQLLFLGALRAYKEAVFHRTLFQFHQESRLATFLLIMAFIGMVALWKREQLRPYALWLTLITVGILLSIPFAPPWDAAERPFAATVPFQGLLAGVGFFALAHRFFVLDRSLPPPPSTMPRSDLGILLFLASLIFFLTVPWPLIHQKNLLTKGGTTSSMALYPGSFVLVTPENRYQLERRMIPFLRHYPSESEFLIHLPSNVFLGIDWNSKNFDRTLLLNPVGETTPFRGWQVDKALLPQN